jgi:hypothetical protein
VLKGDSIECHAILKCVDAGSTDGPNGFLREMPGLWTEEEMRALARAWAAEAAASRARPRSPTAFNDALHRSFLKLARCSAEHRPLQSVLSKRNPLRTLFEAITEFNKTQEDCGEPSWFELPLERRREVRASWGLPKAANDMSWEVYTELMPVFLPETTNAVTTRTTSRSADRSARRPERTGTSRATSGPVSSFEQWEYPELMILARAAAETRRARPSGSCSFDEGSKTPLVAKYREYGGSRRRSKSAIASQAKHLLEAYQFITAFNKQARREGDKSWFHLSADDRFDHEGEFEGKSRVLRLMDKDMFVVIRGARMSSRRRRIKREATEIHQVTERRHYRVSSGESVVSVNEKRRIRSGRYINSTATATLATRREGSSEPPPEVTQLLQRHLRGQSHHLEDKEDEDNDAVITEVRPAGHQTRAMVAAQAVQSDYVSALEHAVTTMSTQLAELDRRLTEARIDGNKRMLVRVLRACRQSGSVPPALVQEMLKRAGSNMLQVVDLANQQQEQDDELMQRLTGALTNGGDCDSE